MFKTSKRKEIKNKSTTNINKWRHLKNKKSYRWNKNVIDCIYARKAMVEERFRELQDRIKEFTQNTEALKSVI